MGHSMKRALMVGSLVLGILSPEVVSARATDSVSVNVIDAANKALFFRL
ncbi:hypothetical protein AB8616_10845 [Marinomonas sp. RS-M-Aa-14]